VLLVAGGVGITPMRALFESLDVAGERLTLLYRVPSEAEILFRDELEAIAAARGAQLLFVVGRSSDSATAVTPERLRAVVPDVAHRDVYLCASPRFAEAVKDAVATVGVPRERLHAEEFVF
jgi:ferredoxin-NADP reductase